MLAEARSARGAVLIYSRTRRGVERWAAKLRQAGLPALAYHAGMDAESRLLALQQFQEEPQPVLVATVAFGMGVDRPDVGLVLHLELPASPRAICRNRAERAVTASRLRCCCSIPMAIAAAWPGRCAKAAMARPASCGGWNRLRKVPIAASRPCCWRLVRWLNPAVVVTAAKTRW